ncbi:MAG: DUF1624 domain-containing protein [Lachnospiraceae bacterium]|nr:DUF1624 domain-containing protein [Lachnospiraceae bacterium]
MICYHGAWDLVYLFGVDWPFYHSKGGFYWQQSICWTFILLSGFCVAFSSRPVRRGILVFSCGALITFATAVFMPSNIVLFGVLTLIGSSMIITGAYHQKKGDNSLHNNASIVLCLLSFGIFLLFRNVNAGHILGGFPVPATFYANLFTAYLGFPYRGFFSTDYFSLLPWFFLFLTGYFLHASLFQKGEGSVGKALEKAPFKGIQFIGRHSLLIYMLHQPALYLLLLFWFFIVTQ